jgi:glucose/arabinose transport system substrate-binding protein
MRGLSRFAWVVIVVAIIVVVVAAVVAVTYKPSTSSVQAAKAPLIFYTWWATEGKVALNHLIPAFENQYHLNVTPMITPGAGGTNAKYAILTLIEVGKPPAMFQSLVGANMLSYVESAPNGVHTFLNLTPILMREGILNHVVTPAFEAAAYNGTILNVPVSVHSGFVLYMNLKLLKKYGLPIPTNLTTLEYDTVKLAQHGVTPWMVPGADGGYDQEQLWFSIFLALGGPHLMDELVYGTIPINNATFQMIFNETNQLFINFTSYNYPGWQSMTWTQGIALVAQGNAAFEVDVDSATNYLYDFQNITTYPAVEPYISWSNVTVIAMPFPGTQNYFPLVMDAVAIPVGPQENQAIQFMNFWVSYAGQEIWTKWKAVTYYLNGTDWYNTPQQWYMYKHLLSTSPNDFVIDPLSLFADVDGQIYSALITLQEEGYSALPFWNSTFASAMHQEESEWLAAAKLGLGYLGFPGHPFGDYYPPWVNSNNQ